MLKRILAIMLTLMIICTTAMVAFADQSNDSAEKQQNAIAMLNWLAFMSRRISDSHASRLGLEELYSELVNDVEPASVDNSTKVHMNELQDKIVSFRMLQQKRNRIQYLLNQAEGQAISKGISTFLNDGKTKDNVKSGFESLDSTAGLLVNISNFMKSGGFAVLTQAIKGYKAYSQAMQDAELTALKSGWELDDEEEKQLYNLRQNTFNYMVDIARQYDLHGSQTLNEDMVADLVYWESHTNDQLRLTHLLSNQADYDSYGNYWLMLAVSYYNLEMWQECVDAVKTYLQLDIQIFRKDHDLARVLPMVVDSLSHLAPNDANFIARAKPYLNLLRKNAGNDEWDLHYFAAMTLLDFCERTPDRLMDSRWVYLQAAWDEIMSVLPSLVEEQRRQNEAWIADVELQYIPSTAGLPESERKAYNDMLKKKRETELAPVYEPLRIFIDLLRVIHAATGDAMTNLYSFERFDLDEMLHPKGEVLFWNESLELSSWFFRQCNTKFYHYVYATTQEHGIVNANYDLVDIDVYVTEAYTSNNIILAAAYMQTPRNVTLFEDVHIHYIFRVGNDPTRWSVWYTSDELNQRVKAHNYQATSSQKIELQIGIMSMHGTSSNPHGTIITLDAEDEEVGTINYHSETCAFLPLNNKEVSPLYRRLNEYAEENKETLIELRPLK